MLEHRNIFLVDIQLNSNKIWPKSKKHIGKNNNKAVFSIFEASGNLPLCQGTACSH